MICSKCNASIPDGSTSCPECGARFETHVGSFAGSVHWEDEVKPAKSEREKRRMILICSVILALVIGFWLIQQTGLLNEIVWFFHRMLHPTVR